MDNKDARGSGEFKLEKPKKNVRAVIRNNEDEKLLKNSLHFDGNFPDK